jgi:cobalamin biosynthetic protein CobC
MALELPIPPLPIHGGDLEAAEARWGRPEAGWLDLSTGINPFPYPVPPLAPEDWARLPGRAAEDGLREAAAAAYGCAPGQVLAAPGTQALIQALPRLMAPTTVAVLSPTYGEHARAWAAAGHDVRPVGGLDETEGAGVVIAVTPNNPTGRVLDTGALAQLAGDRLVVVDEAFADATPTTSIVPLLRPGLVVLRSFGKFYGLAGLRLGFALAEEATLAPLKSALGPWAVSGPALAVGAKALSDTAWQQATRTHLAAEAATLDRVLEDAGLRVLGGTTLFRLAEHAKAPDLYDRLGRAGILVRAFPAQPTWLRFGLPAGGLERLRAAL